MGGFFAFVLWLTLRRIRTGWRLLLASAAAVLLAAAVISAAVIYSEGLAQAGLRHALAQTPPDLKNAQVAVLHRLLDVSTYERLRASVEPDVDERLGWLQRGVERYGLSLPVPVVRDRAEAASPQTILKASPFFFTGFQEHANLVEGQWPGAPADGGDAPLEVAMGEAAARRLGWEVGALRYLSPLVGDASANVAFVVVGIMAPKDTEDEFWFTNLGHFDVQVVDPDEVVSLYAHEETVLRGLGGSYPLLGNYWWNVFLDADRLTPPQVAPVVSDLEGLEADVNEAVPRSYVFSRLAPDLQAFLRRLALARVPVFLFASLVVGALLYYLFLLTGLLSRARGPEAALLRSRGATLAQVGLFIGLGEGVLVSLPAVVLGPVVALALARLLFSAEQGVGVLSLPPETFAWSGGVGLLGLVVLGAGGFGVAGRGIVEFLRERARPPATPLMHRYFLDLLVLALVGLLWWQIQGRGGFVTARLLGRGVEVDPTLLLAPFLVLLSAGLLFLRAWGPLLRLASRAVEPLGVVWLVHAVRRVARDPVGHGAVAVLLVLTISLGVFGALFGATVLATRQDQALYAVGGDVVVQVASAATTTEEETRRGILAVPGVSAVSPQLRATGYIGQSGAGAVSVLALDPETTPRTMWFRDDLADRSLEAVLRPLTATLPGPKGVPLPAGAEVLALWTRTSEVLPPFTLWARFRDDRGAYASRSLGALDTAGWTRREVELADLPGYLTPPFALASVYITGPRIGGGRGGTLAVDDIEVVVAGERVALEGFEGLGSPVAVLPASGTVPDTVAMRAEAARTGAGAVEFAWTTPLSEGARGFVFPMAPQPLPAVGSAGYTVGQALVVTVRGARIPVAVKGVVRYFPTLDPEAASFLILNVEHLREQMGASPSGRGAEPNVYWVGLDPLADRDGVVEALRAGPRGVVRVVDRDREVEEAAGDPLAVAGWRGLALLGMVALVGSSVMGLGLFAWLSVQRARVELAVVRTLGFTRGQVLLFLGVENGVIALAGLALGGALGAWLGRWVLGFLDLAGRGAPSAPPIVISVDPWLLTGTVAGGVGAALGATALAWLLVIRARGYEVLRGER